MENNYFFHIFISLKKYNFYLFLLFGLIDIFYLIFHIQHNYINKKIKIRIQIYYFGLIDIFYLIFNIKHICIYK